jgi:1,4-alpha-glucan branching enzyme
LTSGEAADDFSSRAARPDIEHVMGTDVRYDISMLSEDDLHWFKEGRHFRMWEHFGSHVVETGDGSGTVFGVWAPDAVDVHVIGDFNDWNGESHPLRPRGSSGLWEGLVPGIGTGMKYKYLIRGRDGHAVAKADPLGRACEEPPATSSVIWEDAYAWGDGNWMLSRAEKNRLDSPISIYELHLGSWMRPPHGGFHSYREIAPLLADHVERTGFTHVELLPVMEHPFYGSWGYQVTGYFAPTARYGSPADLKYLVDQLHQRGIGVLFDWVPSHFPGDAHGLALFDGTHLYEHADARLGFHPDWHSWIFNYGRHEVRSFLVSSALYWLEEYHADGLRVDAVASMLYRDYSREEGEWLPNVHGGRENLEAMDMLRALNREVYVRQPDVQTVAEESTAWPMVSRPVETGGLGFGLKWDMGWMHDILRYMGKDPVHRSWHHSDLTFRHLYAFNENFVLPFSHDEVVHGKGSLWSKMAGDEWRKFANLRLLYGCMFAQPGKKLLFMGAELAQRSEWDHEGELEWDRITDARGQGVLRWVSDLNRLYREEPALHELDCESAGFEWIAPDDHVQNVISFLRRPRDGRRPILIICNFSAVPHEEYRVGVPYGGSWIERLNSDARIYGGSGRGNPGSVTAERQRFHGREWSVGLTLPSLASVFLQAAESGG